MTAAEAGQKYRTGIETFGGAEVYVRCGQMKGRGFLAVAGCLEQAKRAALTVENMVTKYMKAAGG